MSMTSTFFPDDQEGNQKKNNLKWIELEKVGPENCLFHSHGVKISIGSFPDAYRVLSRGIFLISFEMTKKMEVTRKRDSSSV